MTGASGAGKSTVFAPLARELAGEAAVFDIDLLIDPFAIQAEGASLSWRAIRAAWLCVASGVAQSGLPTVLLMAPTLLLLRRWRLPFGALTVLFTTVVGLVSAAEGFDMGEVAFAGLAAGLAGDVLVRAVQRRPVSMASTLRIVGAVVPTVLWLAYFGFLAVFYSVGWTVELWAGITCMAALAGFGLAVLMVPPSVPDSVDGPACRADSVDDGPASREGLA